MGRRQKELSRVKAQIDELENKKYETDKPLFNLSWTKGKSTNITYVCEYTQYESESYIFRKLNIRSHIAKF